MTGDELRRLSDRLSGRDLLDEIQRQQDLLTAAAAPAAAFADLSAAALASYGHIDTIEAITRQMTIARQPWIELSELYRSPELDPLGRQRELMEASFATVRESFDAQMSVYKSVAAGLDIVDWQRLLPSFEIGQPHLLAFQGTTERLYSAFSNLALEINKVDPALLKPIVFDIPPLRVTGQQELIESLIEAPEPEEADDQAASEAEQVSEILGAELHERVHGELPARLAAIHPELPNLWKGGTAALRTGNADKIRHSSISLRELVNHLLRMLAPDEEIAAWSQDPDLKQDERYKRSARLEFLARNIHPGGFADFTKKSHKATLAALDLLQKGAHSLDEPFDEERAERLSLVVGGHILLLLDLKRN